MTISDSVNQIAEQLAALSETKRADFLDAFYKDLDRVARQFDLPRRYPLVPVAASDQRGRHEVWGARLEVHPQYTAMPEAVRERILANTVGLEGRIIESRLEEWMDSEQGPPWSSWEWDPTFATAVHGSGYIEPPETPDIDKYLSDAETYVHGELDATIGTAIRGWISDQLEFLRAQEWVINFNEDTTRADATWEIEPDRRRLTLRASLNYPNRWRALSDHEAARFPQLAVALTRAAAGAPLGPVAVAFPTAAAAPTSDSLAEHTHHALDAPQEGRVR
jgi:hypothetical protein